MRQDDLARVHARVPSLYRAMRDGRLDRRAFVRQACLLGVAAPLAWRLVGVAPAAAQAPRPGPRRGEIRVSMRVQDASAPHTLAWVYAANLVGQSNEYLTRTDREDVTRPLLLESWRASDDLRLWTLTLRAEARWSDGSPLTADQVAWNFRRWLDPVVGSSTRALMQSYMLAPDGAGMERLWSEDAIRVVDPRTLELRLKTAQVAVPEHLFHYAAVILHPEEGGQWGVGARGTGPFAPVELIPGARAVFEARDDYWGEGPYIRRLVFEDHGDSAAAPLEALRSRAVHGLYEAQVTQYEALEQIPHAKVHIVATAQTAVARMRVDRPPFDDARVRKAMRLALDPDRLLQVGHLGLGAPGEHHHVSQVQPDYFPLEPMRQDLDGARRLLAEAGYPEGFATRIAGKQDPDWEAITVRAMIEMWERIGVTVGFDLMPSTEYWKVWDKVDFGFTQWSHRPLAVMTLPLAYRTGVPWNESRYSNPRFDSLITQAEATLDLRHRRLLMREIETLMQEDGPIAQPLWRAAFTAFDETVEGFELHPTQYFFAHRWRLPDA